MVGRKPSVLIKPGQLLPANVPDEQLKVLLAEKAIVPLDAPEPVVAEEKMPGIGISDAKFFEKGEQGVQVEAGVKPTKTATAKAVQPVVATEPTPTPQQPQAPAAAGLWTLDANALIGKPIDELRQMVADRDPTMEVNHLDEVELIAVLSADAPESAPSEG